MAPIVKRIRNLERILRKLQQTGAPTAEAEERLKVLREEKVLADRGRREQKHATKYHMVKFFERQKFVRKIHQINKEIDESKDDAKKSQMEETRKQLMEKLAYVLYFPNSMKYIAEFVPAKGGDVEQTEKLRAKAKALALDAWESDKRMGHVDRLTHVLQQTPADKSTTHTEKGKSTRGVSSVKSAVATRGASNKRKEIVRDGNGTEDNNNADSDDNEDIGGTEGERMNVVVDAEESDNDIDAGCKPIDRLKRKSAMIVESDFHTSISSRGLERKAAGAAAKSSDKGQGKGAVTAVKKGFSEADLKPVYEPDEFFLEEEAEIELVGATATTSSTAVSSNESSASKNSNNRNIGSSNRGNSNSSSSGSGNVGVKRPSTPEEYIMERKRAKLAAEAAKNPAAAKNKMATRNNQDGFQPRSGGFPPSKLSYSTSSSSGAGARPGSLRSHSAITARAGSRSGTGGEEAKQLHKQELRLLKWQQKTQQKSRDHGGMLSDQKHSQKQSSSHYGPSKTTSSSSSSYTDSRSSGYNNNGGGNKSFNNKPTIGAANGNSGSSGGNSWGAKPATSTASASATTSTSRRGRDKSAPKDFFTARSEQTMISTEVVRSKTKGSILESKGHKITFGDD